MATKKELESKIENLENQVKITESQIEIKNLQERVAALTKFEEDTVDEDRDIIIYRQYFTYFLKNARVMEVTAKFYLWIPAYSELWIYDLPGYMPSLEAIDSDDNELPILSDNELNMLFTNNDATFVTQESLKNDYISRIKDIDPNKINSSNDKHYVGIILPQQPHSHFQEITLNWTEEIPQNHLNSDYFNKYVVRRHTSEPTTNESKYIKIAMDEKKYEIVEEPTISTTDKNNNSVSVKEGNEYKKILSDKTQQVFRIKRNCPYTFNIEWSVGIPKLIRQWAWAGFFIALPVLAYTILSFLFGFSYVDKELVIPSASLVSNNSKLLAGLIALLIGFRVLVFHDTELLSRWNLVYLSLLGISVSTIIITQLSLRIL